MGKIADTTRTWVIGQEQRRQLLAFDTELEEAKGKVRRLEAKVLDLDKQVRPLESQVEGLKKQLQEQTAKAERAEKLRQFSAEKNAAQEHDAPQRLTEQEEEILRFLAYCRLTDKRPPTNMNIARLLKINEIEATVMVRGLEKRRFIWFDQRIPEGWHLREDGETYVVQHKLLGTDQ